MTNLKILFTIPWLLFLLIPALGLAFYPHFRTQKRYRRNRNRIISLVLHVIILVLCILLIAGLSFKYEVPNKQNELILLVDASYSNDGQKDAKDDFIQDVINECGKKYKLGVVTFGYDQVYASELKNDTSDTFSEFLSAQEPDTSATDIASALEYAASLFSENSTGKIVLLSDGLETDRAALSIIKSIAAEGVQVDTVYFPNSEFDEIQAVSVEKPDRNIAVGEEIDLKLNVINNFRGNDQEVILTVYDGDDAYEPIKFTVTKGLQELKFKHTFLEPGLHNMRFEISCDGDTLQQNNVIHSYFNLEVFDKILIIESNIGESADLQEVLGTDYNVTVLNTVTDLLSFPMTLEDLSQYDQVILSNIANDDLPTGFDELLRSYVSDLGGGLFTTGGRNDNGGQTPHAYNRDDMYGSVLQDLLPVRVVDYTPPVAVMIIIDRSGSMGWGGTSGNSDNAMEGTPLDYAVQGALGVLDALKTGDYCGVMTLESEYTEQIRVTPVSQKDAIRDAIRGVLDMGTDGGTQYVPAIERAGEALAAVDVANRHIILVSDGEPFESREEFDDVLARNGERDITMSIVCIGDGMSSAHEMLTDVCEVAGGEYYTIPIKDVAKVSTIILEDVKQNAILDIHYGEEMKVKIKDRTSILSGIMEKDIPFVTGYYGTRRKDGAVVPLTVDSVPFYAQWNYGKGKVGSLLSDVGGDWTENFVADATGQSILKNIITALMPTADIEPKDIRAELKEDNYTNRVNVFTKTNEGETLSVTVNPESSEARSYYRARPITVTPSDANTRFTFAVTCPGIYRIDVTKHDATGAVISKISLYKEFSYSAEYNVFPDETEITAEEKMAKLAEDGDGIVAKDALDVFESLIKTLKRSFDPRLLFLIIIIVMFLLDIAVRKFKFKWPHELIAEYKAKKKERK